MSASNVDLDEVKEEPRLPSNPYLQQFDDIRTAVITEFALHTTPAAALRELNAAIKPPTDNAAIKPLWEEASKSIRIKKLGNQYIIHAS
jgi:hypothetical protein